MLADRHDSNRNIGRLPRRDEATLAEVAVWVGLFATPRLTPSPVAIARSPSSAQGTSRLIPCPPISRWHLGRPATPDRACCSGAAGHGSPT